MKKVIIFCLVSILLLPLLAAGCGGHTIELSLDDFTAQNNIVKNIELCPGGTITVKLGSNPSTGYQWGDAEISSETVITQISHKYNEPENTELMGAPGTDVFVFDAKTTGSATITISYSRPWEGGEKDTYTLTIDVTVK